MIITSCKTNKIKNPMGYNLDRVTVSWIVDETESIKQIAAQVIVATDVEINNIVYDTGKQNTLSSLGVELPIELSPYTRYYWIVKVWGDKGDEAISSVNWFETGKMESSWEAKWITPLWENKEIHPYMRKKFSISGKIKSARAYATGLGIYLLEINGKRISEEYLTPGCTAYDNWIQYQTYDVTAFIANGENVIGVMLGNGWAKGRFGYSTELFRPYVHDFALLLELRVTLEDGSEFILGTDTDWKCHPSGVLESSLYDGEIYDANKELTDWSTVGINDIHWDEVIEFKPENLGKVQERLSLPIIIKEQIEPVKLIHTPAGEWVLDMGQNMVGWLKIHLREKAGTQIKITFGEVLQDDNFYTENLRSAKQEYIYISDGKERVIEPNFTFYGFRFAKLEGFEHPIQLEDFTGCVVYSDLEETGWIETSNPLINRLFLNTKWGQKGNFLDVPTDCPQRDERLGWTGDIQVFAGTAAFNMDTYAFLNKFLYDMWTEQKLRDGAVGYFVPDFGLENDAGSSGWGDAATIVPWNLYVRFGDESILQNQYESMKSWVDWIHNEDKSSGNKRLWTTQFQFGDWLALDGPIEGGVQGGTDETFVASAFYKYSAQIVAKAAKVLGKDEDAHYYENLSNEIKQAITHEFFSVSGRSTIQTQTAYVLALQFELVPDRLKPRVVEDLVSQLKKDNMHLKTGFAGTPYLCRVLSDNGATSSAYDIFFQEDYPSWLYAVKMGATTIWERWDSILSDGKISGTGMNSLNHYALGSIVDWMYQNMCGIKPIEEAPGFKKFIIKPEPCAKLNFAEAIFKSPSGEIKSRWELGEQGNITINVTVPFDSEAIVYLPDANVNSLELIEKEVIQEGTYVKVKLNAGKYEFHYPLTKDYGKKYSMENTYQELMSVKETREILNEVMPKLTPLPGLFEFRSGMSLKEALAFQTPEIRKRIEEKVNFDEIDKQLRSIIIDKSKIK